MDAEQRRRAVDRLLPAADRARSFSGWTFDVEVTHLGPPLPWDYEALAREHAPNAGWVLDMGTGGGEVLSRVREALPAGVVATEEWVVNAPVAYRRLRPLAVNVVRSHSLVLPFADGAFSLVLNRHEELDPEEVGRVLAPGGWLLTQQVGRDNWCELNKHFPRRNDFGDLHGEYRDGFAAAGLTVSIDRQHDYRVAFGSLEDVVHVLAVTAVWEIPAFDVEQDVEALLALEAEQQTRRGLELTESRHVIAARKPA